MHILQYIIIQYIQMLETPPLYIYIYIYIYGLYINSPVLLSV